MSAAEKVVPISKVGRFMSTMLDRMRLGIIAGLQFGGKRDLYSVFGYKQTPCDVDFYAKYTRQDIASRVIDAPPAATWADPPELILGGTRANKKWKDMIQPLKMWTVLERADRLSRLGPYSLVLLGFDDGKATKQPLGNGSAKNLMYMRAVGQRQAKIIDYETDTKSPRFGLPKAYMIYFSDPTQAIRTVNGNGMSGLKELEVHWTRALHVVENPLDNEVCSEPIILKVFNLLDDLLKISGGTAETYWLTANRGIQADIDKEMELDPNDAKDLADMMEEYQHQQRRILRTRGVKITNLGSDIPDPKSTFEMLMALLSGTTGIPQRILIGSEAGQLASEQDRANWSERIMERRKLHAEPFILCPFVERLMFAGVLPPDKEYSFDWPEAFILSPLERAQTMAATARAVANLAGQTGSTAHMQITSRAEARDVIGLEGDLAPADIELSDGQLAEEKLKQGQQQIDAQAAAAMEAAKNPAPVVAPGTAPPKKGPPAAA